MNGSTSGGLPLSCKGQRVLVTGAATGIGQAIAQALVVAGARVAICDRVQDAVEQCRKDAPEIAAFQADVTSEKEMAALFDSVAATLGGLDVLVNNAGIGGPVKAVKDIELAEWQQMFDVNMTGMFLCTRKAVPMMEQAGGGSIVNISSVAGRMGYAMRSGYSATKWAVIGFTKSLAIELGPANIRANAVLPGVVEGERHRRLFGNRAEGLGITFEEAEQRFFDQVSMRRKVTYEDIAGTVAFLCSDLARNISGQSIGVCGDIQYMRA
jgi:NAD(P)-dependent dehydrogenase (short-subunit alcohol dehydrogenase family)